MATQPGWQPAFVPAPEYSQLPEVSAGYNGSHAPEAIRHYELATAGHEGRPPPTPPAPAAPPANAPLPVYKHESQVLASPAAVAEPPTPDHPPPVQDEPGPRRTTVLILSVVVAILAAAVVGLAAATGIMAKRATDAENASPQLVVNGTTCPAVPSPTAGEIVTVTMTTTAKATTTVVAGTSGTPARPDLVIADVSNGCSARDEQLTGTTYTTRIFGKVTFTRFCNAELKPFPIYGMLTQDFETCMDACASWSSRGPEVVGEDNKNAFCAGVRFVPAWTNRSEAFDKNARGNCFLHAGPLTPGDLKEPNLADGVTCHAAIVVE